MNRIDAVCPHCQEEPGNYFQELLSPEDYDSQTIIKDYDHPAWDSEEGYSCLKGCEQWTEETFSFLCEHCMGEIEVKCTYVQPCDANGYVVEMIWTVPNRATLASESHSL